MPSPSRPVRVAVVNDYPVVVAGLTAMLEPYAPQVQVEGYVEALPPKDGVDVVLLDTFGRPDGLARLSHVVSETEAPVLLYSWAQNQDQIADAMRVGAAGFVPKTVQAEEILAAIEAALAGKAPRPGPSPQDGPMPNWPGRNAGLTPRESEIISLIVAGLTNQEIASSTYLSINSVKTYIRTAYRKMNVASRAQAVIWAIDHGFHLHFHPEDRNASTLRR
jgi:two-component system, NarL family, response regulator LiaR